MLRLSAVAVAASVLLATSACTGPETGRGPEPDAKGCDPCASQVETVRKRLAALPEVDEVSRIEYAPRKNITRPPTLSIDLRIAAGSVDTVRVAALKATWLSRITPLDDVLIYMKTPDGQLTTQNGRFYDKAETKVYEREWGPRPVQ